MSNDGQIHVVDLDSFSISHSKQFVPQESGASVGQIRTLDNIDIYVGIRKSPDTMYFRTNFNLDNLAEFIEAASGRARTFLDLYPSQNSDEAVLYLGEQTYFAASRNKDFELLDVVGGEGSAYPYYVPGTSDGCFYKLSKIAHDPDHDKPFLYYGGRRSLNYWYYTGIYAVPLDDMESVPNGDFKAIGHNESGILRDDIMNWLHYVDGDGIPYMFCSGVDFPLVDPDVSAVWAMAKVRLTDPWTITRTSDNLRNDVAVPDHIATAGTQRSNFLYDGSMYIVGSNVVDGTDIIQRKAITIMNPDTMVVDDKYHYHEEEELSGHFISSIVDEEEGVFYAGTSDTKLLKINLSTMDIVDHINFPGSGRVMELQFVTLMVPSPILNLSQISNKIKVGWEYDTE